MPLASTSVPSIIPKTLQFLLLIHIPFSKASVLYLTCCVALWPAIACLQAPLHREFCTRFDPLASTLAWVDEFDLENWASLCAMSGARTLQVPHLPPIPIYVSSLCTQNDIVD